MLTGVETAGLVLASFPILFHAIEGYKSGCEPLVNWWRFQAALRKERFVQDHIQVLLNPVIDSEEELKMLCDDLAHPLWRSQRLEQTLQKQLGERYGLYVETVNMMNGKMQEVIHMLHAQQGKAGWTKTPDFSWKNEYRRVEICLRKKEIDKLLDEAMNYLQTLDKHLENTERLSVPRRGRGTRLVKLLGSIRDNARGLHTAICASWNCACPYPHTGHLFLEHRPQAPLDPGAPIQFKLTFLVRTNETANELQLQEVDFQSLVTSEKESDQTGTVASAPSGSNISQDSVKSATSSKKRITFQGPAGKDQVSPSTAQRLVTSLCSTLKATRNDINLGALRDQNGRCHIIKSCRCSSRSTSKSSIRLGEALRSLKITGHTPALTLSRGDRTFLAMLTASSVLQLYRTPWLPTVSKQDIKLFKFPDSGLEEGRLDVSRPMISSTFRDLNSMADATSTLTTPTDNADANTREIMLRLGIILLELCFGEAIEDQPFRELYYGPDKKPHRFTDCMTAKEWSDKVVGEAGLQYAEVVKRCIDCNFGLIKADLDDLDFRQAVYENVVEPLRNIAEQFSTDLR